MEKGNRRGASLRGGFLWQIAGEKKQGLCEYSRTGPAQWIGSLPAYKPVHQRVAGFDKHTGRSRRLFAEAGDAIVLLFLAVV